MSETENRRAKPRAKAGASNTAPPGLAARELSVDLIVSVLHDQRAFDVTWARLVAAPAYKDLAGRDLGLARTTAANALRFALPLDEVVAGFIEKPLPARQGRVAAILLAAATQLLLLDAPPRRNQPCRRADRPRAPLDPSQEVRQRRLAQGCGSRAEGFRRTRFPITAIPPWLWRRWTAAYGAETARSIAEACLLEAPLDLTLKDPARPRTGPGILARGSWPQDH